MLATSRTMPSAAPTSSVMSGVLRFMWGPTQLEAQRVQYCAEVSQFSLTPDATGRATPRRRFPGQAGGEASGRCGGSRSGSWIPLPGTWRRPDLQSKDPGSRYTGYSTRVQQMPSWSDDGRPALALMGCVGHCPRCDEVRGPPPSIDEGVGPLTSTGGRDRGHASQGAASVQAQLPLSSQERGRLGRPNHDDVTLPWSGPRR